MNHKADVIKEILKYVVCFMQENKYKYEPITDDFIDKWVDKKLKEETEKIIKKYSE